VRENEDRQPTSPGDATTAPDVSKRPSKRRYEAPMLTQYGRVDDLVDSGVVGSEPSGTLPP
jgi:hypothetical protein